MSAESPRHARSGGPLTVPAQPPSDRSIIDAVSGFINDVTLASSNLDPKDIIQWARFETADINEPTPEGDSDNDITPLLLILGYGSGVQVWLISPNGEAQEVLSWRQGTVRVLRILPTPQHGDCFASKRPLIALCDSASPGPTFCSLSFISIRGGEQVKSIKFKNPILDVLANKRSVVVSFSERFAVFDAATLEDRMAVTTCYPCPCPLGGSMSINPLALGDRWLAYADKKLNQSKRSSGGCEGEGVASYTATVLHAAKSLSKGLRGLGESVAQSLSGGRSTSQSPSPPNADAQQPGVVTVIDIVGADEEDGQDSEEPWDPIVAHFVAHSEAIIALKFDASGMLLVTADRRGHDFHVFRINPHPCGPSLASVHHLYILHRGDTTAKVQDIAISPDSRWMAISTLRGTTHVFAISPYGGPCGVRTHTQPRVVNRLSRFHRSAGLPLHAHPAPKRPSHSPVGDGITTGTWFPNPRLPPYPLPTTAGPMAQLRPTANLPTHTITRTSSGRQRLSSLSEDSNSIPLLARARFGPAAAGGVGAAAGGAGPAAGGPGRPPAAPVAALYLMAANGVLLHLALYPRPQPGTPKEKICDETPIDLQVETVAQWSLQRGAAACDLLAPLPPANPLLRSPRAAKCADVYMSEEERWLSQVEIVTHAGPHRRLWMGPQFVFKTYNCTGSSSSLSEAEAVEVEPAAPGAARSTPVNMPAARPPVPVLVDSGSASSVEHSPSDSFRRKSLLSEGGRTSSLCDVQLREDLAEAMKEDHGWLEESGSEDEHFCGIARSVDPLGCVVAARSSPRPPPLDDRHTRENQDEGMFRPVIQAAAALPLPTPPLRPLPHTTTIPVQPLGEPHPTETCKPGDRRPTAGSATVSLELATNARNDSARKSSERISDELVSSRGVGFEEVKCASVSVDLNARPALSRHEKKSSRKSSERASDEPSPRAEILDKNRDVISEDVDVVSQSKECTPPIKINKSSTSRDEKKSSNRKSSQSSSKRSMRTVATCGDGKQPLHLSQASEMISTAKEKHEEIPKDEIITENSDKCENETSSKKVKLPTTRQSLQSTQISSEIVSTALPTTSTENVSGISLMEELYEASKEKNLKDEDQAAILNVKWPAVKHSVSSRLQTGDNTKLAKAVSSEVEVNVPYTGEPTEAKKEKSPVPNKKKEKDGVMKEVVTESNSAQSVVSSVKPLKWVQDEIKTEDQAWDMLMKEVDDKPLITTVGLEEVKTRSKKNRKIKKAQDDVQDIVDDDTFVEIHAIEKQQLSCGELVSISSPFEDVDACNSFVSKPKKSRSSKSVTPDRSKEYDVSVELKSKEELSSCNMLESNLCDVDLLSVLTTLTQSVEDSKIKARSKTLIKSQQIEPETIMSDTFRLFKNKSLSPYKESRKSTDIPEVKDLYVIDSTQEEFPEIQITKGNKQRKRSPQLSDYNIETKQLITEKPVKSWSSIAASKNVKKVDDSQRKSVNEDNKEKTFEKCKEGNIVDDKTIQVVDVVKSLDTVLVSSNEMSFQEKLYELCKRRDIMVAQCDAPSEKSFIEEHHLDVNELPPLEPLDFGLNDFKLEVMRDSILEVTEEKLTSPIYKINIDDILSSIKETTSRAIESSSFNLIDLEKVPAKKEKGYSVVESHKITTQEIKLDDELKSNAREADMNEKSSDEDNASPVISTDSDKEDKKVGSSKSALPSQKQPTKSKKSRRKKK